MYEFDPNQIVPAAESVTFWILGDVEVRLDGMVREVGPAKQRRLLVALLLARGAPVSLGTLEAAVWGETPPRGGGKNSLQVYVSQLRSLLNDRDRTIIRHAMSGYRAVVDPDTVDFYRFDRLVGDGLAELADHQPARALGFLDEALCFDVGQPLAAMADSIYAESHIAYFEQRRRAATAARLDALLRLGRYELIIPDARRLLAEDPYNEAVWYTLMLGLYHSHRRIEALRSFQEAAHHLAELGMEPSGRLAALEASILTQDPPLALPPVGLGSDPVRLRPERLGRH